MTLQVAKNAFYLTIASVGQKLLSLVYFLVLARVMRPESTGAYFLTLSFIIIFFVVADLGITSVVIRDVAKAPERARDLVRTAMGIKIPATVFAIATAIVASILLGYDPLVRHLILLATFILIADSFSIFFYGVLRGFQKLSYESIGMFAGQLVTLVIGLIVMFTSASLPLLIVALITGSTLNLVLSAIHVGRRIGWRAFLPVWNRPGAAVLLKHAFPFFLAAIFVKLYNYFDIQFLYWFHAAATVGLYSVAYKFTYAFQFLPLSFVAALYPGMSRLVGKDDAGLARLFDQAMWYMLLISVPVAFGLWAVAPEVVALTGTAYAAAAPILAVLVFALLPNFLDFPVGSLLNAAGRQGTKTVIFGATMVVNLLLNWAFIPTWGMMGAAWASIASITFLFVTGMTFVPKIISGYRYGPLIKMAVPIVLSGWLMGLASRLFKPWSRDAAAWIYQHVPIPSALAEHLGLLLTIAFALVVYLVLLVGTRSLRKEHVVKIRHLFRRSDETYVSTPTP